MQDHIEKYCSIGWCIFPVEIFAAKDGKITKKPLITDWINKATNKHDEAVELFKAFPNAGIGVATGKRSGITVIDIDVKAGKNGFVTLEALNITIPATATQVTPTGGQHKFFKYTPDLKNSVSTIDGVDVRNDGGFIVLAPSVFPDGRSYEWNIEEEPWNYQKSQKS